VTHTGWLTRALERWRRRAGSGPSDHADATPAPSAAASYWGHHRGYAPNWYGFCQRYIMESVTGDPEEPGITYWALRTFAKNTPVDALLEIGCLEGRKLVGFMAHDVARRGYGIDIAEAAIQRGQEAIRAQGLGDRVELSVMDLNRPSLPAASFDVVLSNGVLHHVSNLRPCLENLHQSLREGGVLIASEFVGPTRYRYSPEEIELINEGIGLLPPELGGGRRFDPVELRPKLEADPSEAVCSESLEPEVRAVFEDVTVRPYGGNVLMRALNARFFANFDPERHDHVAAYERVLALEKAALGSGHRSHHILIVARKGPPGDQ
jgi:SAM-dependent methyltransferase